MSAPRRRELIQALQDIIVKACPVAESFVYETIANWTAGGEPATPVERAVFQVIDELVAGMDEKAEAEPDLDDKLQEEDERHESRGTLADSQDAREFYEKERDS